MIRKFTYLFMVLLLLCNICYSATVSTGYTYNTTDQKQVTAANLNASVNDATVTNIVSADITDETITSADIKNDTIVNADINSAAGIEVTKLDNGTEGQVVAGGAATGEYHDFFNAFANSATNDSLGLQKGGWLKRVDVDTLSVSAGAIQIDKKIYFNVAASTVDVAESDSGTYSAAGTSGVDSSTTIALDTFYYVFLTTRTDDTDNYLILINDDATPADRAIGVTCRAIGRFWLDDAATDTIQMVYNYRPDGVYGWNFFVGNGTGSQTISNTAFGVTFTRAPYVDVGLCGSLDSGVVDISSFTETTNINKSYLLRYGITTTNFDLLAERDSGNFVVTKDFGFIFEAKGDWNL